MLIKKNDVNVIKRTCAAVLDEEEKAKCRNLIAERAYYKAKKRGFSPGHELDDWIEAEKEIMHK